MNLPATIAALVQAQNNFDHIAYADCFDKAAIVHDEGQTHHGKAEIKEWIKQANAKYKAKMVPLNFTQSGPKGVLTAEISGTLPGSPAVLQYHLELAGDLISSLRMTG